MNTVIIGQGAIGQLFYHAFSTVYSKKISLLPSKRLRENSKALLLRFTSNSGVTSTTKVKLTQNKDLKAAEVIIICVKSYQVINVINEIQTDISQNAIIILAHNGLGTYEEIKVFLSKSQRILALLTTHGAKKITESHVTHTGIGESNLGLLSGVLSSQEQDSLTQFLTEAFPVTSWQDDIVATQWRKLAVNAVINPITAIENIDNGEVFQPDRTELVSQLVDEIIKVASKVNLIFIKTDLIAVIKTVCHDTAKNTSSMRADILARRKTEIDYINGYIQKLAIKHHINTPNNAKLISEVKRLENEPS